MLSLVVLASFTASYSIAPGAARETDGVDDAEIKAILRQAVDADKDGRYQDALGRYGAALDLADRRRMPQWRGRILVSRGIYFMRQGARDDADHRHG